MDEVFFFLKQGWKNIWNMRTVWLFSALSFIADFYRVFVNRQETDLSGAANWLAANMISLILLVVAVVAIPYLVFSFSIGKPATIEETFSAVGQFGVRVILSGCLTLLVLSPCFVLVLALSLDASTQPPQLLNRFFVLSLPLSLLIAMFYFPIFEFFAKDGGIRQSLSVSWNLFTSHFRVLAALGVVTALLYRAFAIAAGLLTVLIQSGFNGAALPAWNYINPDASLSGNLLFLLIDGAGQMIYTAWYASIFALAYLKYSGVKIELSRKKALAA